MSDTAPAPTTIGELIEAQARAIPDKPYLLFGDRVVTYAQLNANVNRAANGLADLGVSGGAGVSIMMPNSPEWLFVYFGVQKLGAYAVPVNVALRGEGLRHVVGHSDSSVLVCHPDYVDAIQEVADSLPALRYIVIDTSETGPGYEAPADWIRLSDLMNTSAETPDAVVEMGAMSNIMYTSGTTGAPKGVVQRYRPLAPANTGLAGGFYRSDEILYTCLPLFHANALFLTCQRALMSGLTVALSQRFSASRFWDEVRRYKATTFNALGAMIPILMKQPERENDRDNRVGMVLSAACPASVWDAFEQRFGVRLLEAYGAVDGGGFGISNPGTSPRGSIGKPATPIRIVDESGNDCAPGEPGELLFKIDDPEARRVEYYKNAEASDAKVRDGWLHTGDLVYQDADGNVFFADRKTDSMRRRGENISSWEVEREINAHPAVLESAAFGVPSELGEDDVMVVAVLREGQKLMPEELIAHCEKRMAKFMIPRYVEFRGELPKTGTHRVQKSELKRQGVTAHTWDREKATSRS
ncbi:MAG: AMP-binding protein [Dehalococcoidia bacterium]|nr:ATP-dependent acyl-CoA ligase [Chloroflexi bacterium CFX7]NUQ56314.1 AMP-binding protein [Dehalococcoidia bacterium]